MNDRVFTVMIVVALVILSAVGVSSYLSVKSEVAECTTDPLQYGVNRLGETNPTVMCTCSALNIEPVFITPEDKK